MKKANTFIVTLLSLTMTFSTYAAAFADTANVPEGSVELTEAEVIAEKFEDVVEMNDVSDAIAFQDSEFTFEDKISIPVDSEESIETILESGETIEMNLPSEVDVGEGILTDDGSIVYVNDDNTSLCVQVMKGGDEEAPYISTRTMVSIENADAPKEYSFAFNLPSGFEIVSDRDYNMKERQNLIDNKEEILDAGVSEEEYQKMLDSLDESLGEYYILNAEGMIVQIVEAAWAKDAAGNDVKTHYELRDSTIVQVVDFDSESLFPIIADPTVGNTEDFSVKISNLAMGLPSVAGTPITKAAKKVLKTQTKKKIVAVVGSKFLPGLNIATYVLGALAWINEATGKKGVEVYGTMIYRKSEYHKEGTITYGWDVKSMKMRRY